MESCRLRTNLPYGISLAHVFLGTETRVRFLQRSLLSCLTRLAFVLIPDGTGSAKFAVDVGVAALKTFLTQIGTMLGARVAGFSVWMIHAFSHVRSLI